MILNLIEKTKKYGTYEVCSSFGVDLICIEGRLLVNSVVVIVPRWA